MKITGNDAKGTPPPKKKMEIVVVGEGGVRLKRMQASKPLAKALRALAKALSKSSARHSFLSEP